MFLNIFSASCCFSTSLILLNILLVCSSMAMRSAGNTFSKNELKITRDYGLFKDSTSSCTQPIAMIS